MSETPTEPTPLVSLEELRTFMNMPAQEDRDGLLQEVLDAALAVVAEQVDASLTDGAVTYQVRPNGRHLVLPMTHLRSVTSVTDPQGRTIPSDRLDINLLSGIVTVPAALAGTWTVVATPRQGNAPIKQAVKIIASHLWGTQRGLGGGVRANAYANPGEAVPSGFALPKRALELLAPYRHL